MLFKTQRSLLNFDILSKLFYVMLIKKVILVFCQKSDFFVKIKDFRSKIKIIEISK